MTDVPNAIDPFAHGLLGALAPSWWEPEPEGPEAAAADEGGASEPEPWLTTEEAYERFMDWVASRGIEPWEHQEDALFSLAAGSNVILGTPTGSGKSLVALGMMFMAMASGQRFSPPDQGPGVREVLLPGRYPGPRQRRHDHRRLAHQHGSARDLLYRGVPGQPGAARG